MTLTLGQQTGTYACGPYGEPANDNWTGARFRYTGQIALPEVRLYHYKARVYDPGLGRFLQTDPIGYEDDLNLYAYVANDPVSFVDPEGETRRRVGPSPQNVPLVHPLAQAQLNAIQRTLPDYRPPAASRNSSHWTQADFVLFRSVNRALDLVGRSNFSGGSLSNGPSSAFGQIITNSSSWGRTGSSSTPEYQFFTGRSPSQAVADFSSLMQGGGAARAYANGTMSFGRSLGDGLSVTYSLRTDSQGGRTIEARFTQDYVPTGSRIIRQEHVLTIKGRYDR